MLSNLQGTVRRAALVGAAAATLTAAAPGCVTTSGTTADEAATAAASDAVPPGPTAADVDAVPARVTFYVDGAVVSPEHIVGRLRAASVVCLGEAHDRPDHHAVQAWALRALADRPYGVAFEMVTWPGQSALDAFGRGATDFDALSGALDWETTWGFSPALYAQVFEAARARGGPLVAANPPRRIVRTIARKGLGALSADDVAKLPRLDMSHATHRAAVRDVFDGFHPGGKGDDDAFERFYTAQVLWDASMARAVRQLVRQRAAPAVLIAGNGHVALPGSACERAILDGATLRLSPVETAAEAEAGLDDPVGMSTVMVLMQPPDAVRL